MMKTVFIITFHASANKAGTLAQKLQGEDEGQGVRIQIRKGPTTKRALTHVLPGLCGRPHQRLTRVEKQSECPTFNG